MSTEPETPIPAAPSPGVISRFAEKFGFKTETSAMAEIKDELAAMTLVANEAAAEAEVSKAEIARQNSVIAGLQAKVSALDSVIPGITASADPAAALTETITRRTADQVAAMGLPPGEAPDNDPKPNAQAEKTMSHDDFRKLPPAEANAFMRDGGKLTE